MRSHLLYQMDLKTLEKFNEKQWHISEGRHDIADLIQEHDLKSWESQKASKLVPKWRTSVNQDSIELMDGFVQFKL